MRLASIDIPGQGAFDYSDYQWTRPQLTTLPGYAGLTGIKIEKTYDALQRTMSINTLVSGVDNQLMYRNYKYSPVGNIIEKETEHGLYTYTYDALSRLTYADNPEALPGVVEPAPEELLMDEEFTYDALGNRITDNVIGEVNLEYNLNNELINLGGTVLLSYDLNGNMTDNSWPNIEQRYVYDESNRLKRINNYDQDPEENLVANYYYDPFGRRLWKEVNGVRTYFLYANEGLIAEFDADGNETRSYGYMPGSTWTTNPLYQKHNGTYYWYLNDHLGTPQKMIKTDGEVVWSARYDSFGNTIIDIETVENNLRFSGQYYDSESGLHYNWNRYYDPFLGRYLQADPLGLDAGMNYFVYCNGNPGNYIDPMGLEPNEGEDGYYDDSGYGSYGEEDTGQRYESGGYSDRDYDYGNNGGSGGSGGSGGDNDDGGGVVVPEPKPDPPKPAPLSFYNAVVHDFGRIIVEQAATLANEAARQTGKLTTKQALGVNIGTAILGALLDPRPVGEPNWRPSYEILREQEIEETVKHLKEWNRRLEDINNNWELPPE